MKYSSEQLLILLAILPNMLVALLAFLAWRRLPANIRPLALLTWFALFTEACCRVLWLLKLNNLFMLPLYISVEFGLLIRLYQRQLTGRWLSRLHWPLVIGLGALAAIERLLHSSWPVAYSHGARLLESLFVIVLVFRYYYASLHRPTTAYIWREPLFWISTGLLLFFAGTFLIYTVTGFVFYYNRPAIIQMWVIHAGINVLLYCTYAYALWLSYKT